MIRNELSDGATPAIRAWSPAEVVSFRRTSETFGGLSNMAHGFPLLVNGRPIGTSEALYQACRFPHLPHVQGFIVNEFSPMKAKALSREHRCATRPDWDAVRVPVMAWCLRVKLAQHRILFGGLLLSTGERPIVESSRHDDFWGAKPSGDQNLIGRNVLGRLLMELRETLRRTPQSLETIDPLAITQFMLLGEPIAAIASIPPRGFRAPWS